ncbi:MAG: sulfurtransferase [Hyphomonadaceae bacterium]|nr:sulfurtransferase [Hyphomonadaceae bacterium]
MPYREPDPLVSAEWLMSHMDAPDVRVIEATWYIPTPESQGLARRHYEAGHIPGAVFFDIDEICAQDTDVPHMLPDTVFFASRVRKMGIGDGNRLVVYDRNNLMASARVWWMLRAMGAMDVRVLDGGLKAWEAAGGELEDMAPMPGDRHFTPRFRTDIVKTKDQVLAAMEAGDVNIIDARPPGRFSGEAPEPRKGVPSGHIPGSRNICSVDLLNADGTMKSVEALRELFGDVSGPVITTCGSGVTAANLALALARLGRNAGVYDGSWTEWATSEGYPIETGPGN